MSDLRPVQFTLESAERIANAVRSVETAPRPTRPLVFDRIPEGRMPKAVRMATYTGTWDVGSPKTVTFFSSTNTAIVQNLFFPVTIAGGNCAIAKDGTAWYLIDVRANTASATFVSTASASVVTDISVSGSFNSANCSITVGRTLTTTRVTVVGMTSTSNFVRAYGG